MIYQCDVCSESFNDQLLLDAHFQLLHSKNLKQSIIPFDYTMEWNEISGSSLMNENGDLDCDDVLEVLCEKCGELFKDEILCDIHRELHHDEDDFNYLMHEYQDFNVVSSVQCNECGEVFKDNILCDIHREIFHGKVELENVSNYEKVYEGNGLNDDVSSTTLGKLPQEGNCSSSVNLSHPGNVLHDDKKASTSSQKEESKPIIQVFAEALEGKVARHYRINNLNTLELISFLNQAKLIIINTLKTELNRLNCLKFNILLDANFSNVENEISHRGFIARSRSLLKTSNLDDRVEECMQEIVLKITEHEARGSGWSLLDVLHIDVRVHKQGYGDRGSSFIPLPKRISDTKSCINVQNVDNECFKYAMVTKFLLNETNNNRPSRKYRELFKKYNFAGIKYPVSLSDVRRFERNNNGVSVNIFALDERNNVFPLQITSKELRDHTDLLLLKDGDSSHYVFIKDLNSLVSRQLRRKDKHRLTVCKRCLNYTGKPYNLGGYTWLLEHTRICEQKPEVKIQLPSESQKTLVFKNISHQYRIPIVIYADFEASLLPTSETDANKDKTRVKYQKHEPNSFCLLLKSSLNEDHLQHYGLSSKPILYRGVNAAKKFVDELYDIVEKVELLYSYVVPMENLSDSEILQYQLATCCYICQEPFTDDNVKVRDHDHLTGSYRGAACNACNINYKLPKHLPIVLHNLSRYDSHFIIPELGRDKNPIDVLATTNENFISFSKKVGKMKLRFIDSFKFLSSSIMKLTESLHEDDLIETKKIVPEDKLGLVTRKGVFCYDYIDSLEKFNETHLPSIEHFYSKLNEEEIEPDDYQHACNVWTELGMKTLGEYSDFYVKLDVTLLCDIMEEFRNTCFNSYGLDPLHSFTLPGFAWQAMLKETKCNLELLTDIDMILMFESSIRGGITQSVTRQVIANNKYLKDYNPSEESVYLGYFDANNLYGWAMSKPLPRGEFKWIDPKNLGDISSLPEDGGKGYILEFDFEYPDSLHDHHYDFPFFPKAEIPPNGKYTKLLTTLKSKSKYIAHYLNVQQAMKAGIKITKTHRVIEFTQSCWLKAYIDSNTKRRVAAKTKFQKDLFKLMNNAIYGKSLENKRQHKNVKLVTDRRKFEKLVALPNFKTSIIINDNLIAVVMDKTVVKMDRPLYVGMCILDISKRLMYDFHFNKMVQFYGRERIGISYTDTDSFVYWIKTDDMYEDLKTFPYKNEFDFSDYPLDHPNYDGGINKKVLGKFKDETNGAPIKEIIALAAKMYSMNIPLTLSEEEKLKRINKRKITSKEEENSDIIKKAKGIKQLYVKKHMKMEHYRSCLQMSKIYTATYNTIRSFNHEIFSIKESKKSLSPYDDKRIILKDGIHTIPYGHYLFQS